MSPGNQRGHDGRPKTRSFVYSPCYRTLTVVTWIGINDVSYMRNPPDQLRSLFQLEDQLYAAGARNFIFLTVPPFDRSPWGNLPVPTTLTV